jgi:RNA polymerase sigma-70 factor (ECF subfamily)
VALTGTVTFSVQMALMLVTLSRCSSPQFDDHAVREQIALIFAAYKRIPCCPVSSINAAITQPFRVATATTWETNMGALVMSTFNINQIHAGDHATFDRLFDTYAPRVIGYLFRLTGSRGEAEDLTQETFLAAYVGRSSLRGDSQPLAWLLGIARRRCRDRQRRLNHVSEPLEQDTAVSGQPERSMADAVITALTLDAALSHLKVTEREVLLLTAVAGLTYAEAAQVLEVPVGTLKWRLQAAIRKLRSLLNTGENHHEAPSEIAIANTESRAPGSRRDRPAGGLEITLADRS